MGGLVVSWRPGRGRRAVARSDCDVSGSPGGKEGAGTCRLHSRPRPFSLRSASRPKGSPCGESHHPPGPSNHVVPPAGRGPTDPRLLRRILGWAGRWERETAECSCREEARRWQQRPASCRGASRPLGTRAAGGAERSRGARRQTPSRVGWSGSCALVCSLHRIYGGARQ